MNERNSVFQVPGNRSWNACDRWRRGGLCWALSLTAPSRNNCMGLCTMNGALIDSDSGVDIGSQKKRIEKWFCNSCIAQKGNSLPTDNSQGCHRDYHDASLIRFRFQPIHPSSFVLPLLPPMSDDIRSYYYPNDTMSTNKSNSAVPHQILPDWAEKSGIDKTLMRDLVRYLREKNYVICENIYKCTCANLQCSPVLRVGELGRKELVLLPVCDKCATDRCAKCQRPTSFFYGAHDDVCFQCR